MSDIADVNVIKGPFILLSNIQVNDLVLTMPESVCTKVKDIGLRK